MIDLIGGARRNRTDDLFNAIEALSQLSYGPNLQNVALRLGEARLTSEGGGITANLRRPQGSRAKKAAGPRRATQVSSSGAMSPSMRLGTSSSSSSSSSSGLAVGRARAVAP